MFDEKKGRRGRPLGDYEVGYGRPPAASRFEKGQSGNPKGRPRGSKNRTTSTSPNEELMKAIFREEAYRMVSVNDGQGQVMMPMVQAVARSIAVRAAKGDHRSQRLFTQLLGTIERDQMRQRDELVKTAIDYKVGWEEELERRNALGITHLPEPLPHPDHIVIDMHTRDVRITGPMTEEQKAVWDKLQAQKQECDETIAELEEMLKEKCTKRDREFLLDDIEREKRIRARIARMIPD
jgi:hypothetical protein